MEKADGVTHIQHFYNLKHAAIKREATKNARRLAHENNRCIICTLPRPCAHGHDENAHHIVAFLPQLTKASLSHSLIAPSPNAQKKTLKSDQTRPEGHAQRRLAAWKLKKAKELTEMEEREKNDVLSRDRAWKKRAEQTSARLRELKKGKLAADATLSDAEEPSISIVESEKRGKR